MNTTIIGNGTVGKALGECIGVEPLGPSNEMVSADVVIICVPTETVNGIHDQKQVEQALLRIESAKAVILRSTVLPGTTERLQKTCETPILFVPEFGFETTMVEDLRKPDMYIVGVTDKSKGLASIVLEALPPAEVTHVVRATSAEFAKYYTNIWGCVQVMLANSFYDWTMARTGDEGIYTEAIEMAQKHPNMPHWGWRIFDQGFRGYGGKCLPKDIQAALSQYHSPLWYCVETLNNELRGKEGQNEIYQ